MEMETSWIDKFVESALAIGNGVQTITIMYSDTSKKSSNVLQRNRYETPGLASERDALLFHTLQCFLG
jgi:hypothetical protein